MLRINSLAIAALSIAVGASSAQSVPVGPDSLWMKTYGPTGIDEGHCVRQTTDGGYIVAGWSDSWGTGANGAFFIKTDDVGDSIWMRHYGGTLEDRAISIEQALDGSYISAGYTESYGAGDLDFWLMRLSAGGAVLWDTTFGGTGDDRAYDAEQTPADSGYVIVGESAPLGSSDYDVLLVKTDSEGHMLWTRTYGGSEAEHGYSLDQIPSGGGYFIAGRAKGYGTGNYDYYVVRTDTDGDTLWTRRYGSSAYEHPGEVRYTPDGGCIVVGSIIPSINEDSDILIVKVNADGDMAWTRVYGGPDDDSASSIDLTADGGYIIAGRTWSYGAGQSDFYLIKLRSNGSIAWAATYGGYTVDWAYSVRQTDDGGYILVGATQSFGTGSVDVLLVRTEPYS